MTSFAVIIPARFASSRFPGKPLVALKGAGGASKTLVRRSWERASAIEGCSGVWVATDDNRIAAEVEGFGGKVIMTSPDCRNGTERCAEALGKLDSDAEFIVNLQGDAPLTPVELVPAIVDRLVSDREAVMATPVVRCSPGVLAHLRADEAAGRVGGTTAVIDRRGRAMYFSKKILPYLPQSSEADGMVPVFLHLGLYAYRRSGIEAYRAAPLSDLEQAEGLEQLRFLENGLPVAVVVSEPLAWDPIELNNPSDIPAVESQLARLGLQ